MFFIYLQIYILTVFLVTKTWFVKKTASLAVNIRIIYAKNTPNGLIYWQAPTQSKQKVVFSYQRTQCNRCRWPTNLYLFLSCKQVSSFVRSDKTVTEVWLRSDRSSYFRCISCKILLIRVLSLRYMLNAFVRLYVSFV